MSIIVRRQGQEPEKLEPEPFDRETNLQAYIAKHPEAIPIDELADELQLKIVGREFSTPSGPIDALGVDQNGQIYIVETKLYHNPDKRRIVAQLLDYAAALWGQYANDCPAFLQAIKSRYGFDIENHLQAAETFDESGPTNPLVKLRANLEAGRFHLIVLMDQVDDRLKDLVVFINQNSQFSLYAVELKYYQHQDLEIIIPHLYGHESKRQLTGQSKGSTPSTKEEFWQDMADRTEVDRNSLGRFIETVETTASQEPAAATGFSLSGSSNLQSWWIWVDGRFCPVYLTSNGRLYLQCDGPTVYHQINRKLVDQLADAKILGRTKNDKAKSRVNLNLNKAQPEEIDRLCELYRTTTKSATTQP